MRPESRNTSVDETRRRLLRTSLFGALATFVGGQVAGCGSGGDGGSKTGNETGTGGVPGPSLVQPFGPLQAADRNGLRLPAGFTSRIVARSGQLPVPGSGYAWHAAPDGGATFAAADGGWIYVSNSEISRQRGGAGALRFDAAGRLIDAYSILDGTSRNCAGGPTPWDTWLSCEETDSGNVWECDPFGGSIPARLPALGAFNHEAAAVDPVTGIVYLSEDQGDGRFYRFIPERETLDGRPDLSTGILQAAEVIAGEEGPVRWHDVPDPAGAVVATRYQVEASTPFNRGEGLWYDSGMVYMATTADNRIWAYDVPGEEITVLYDGDALADPVLKKVDNVTVSPRGDIFVAEDGDDMQLVALTPNGDIEPVLQVVGHDDSEIAGPALDPSGTRLYFSSQRGATGSGEDGVTYEIEGPFQA